MSEHILIIIWLGLCAIVASKARLKKTVLIDGVEEKRDYWLFAFIAFLPLILYAGNRSQWLFDTSVYVYSFDKVPVEHQDFWEYFSGSTKDKGFLLFSFIVKRIFGSNFTTFFLVVAFVQGLCLISVFRKYSDNYIFTVFLFVVSTNYVGWMYNGIRQFLAISLVFAATPFLIRKKLFPVIICVLLASTIHQSALIMLPIVFIAQGKAWNKKTLLFILLIVISIVFLDQFTNLLGDIADNTQYAANMKMLKEVGYKGTNPLRVIVYSIPTIIAFIYRKQIEAIDNKVVNICVNMSIVTTALYVLSMFMNASQIGRLPGYTILYTLILLPWEFNNLVKDKKAFYIISSILYLVFYYYQMHFVWNLI